MLNYTLWQKLHIEFFVTNYTKFHEGEVLKFVFIRAIRD